MIYIYLTQRAIFFFNPYIGKSEIFASTFTQPHVNFFAKLNIYISYTLHDYAYLQSTLIGYECIPMWMYPKT
jgi:hypothetical protein